jgi:hypothetical protein
MKVQALDFGGMYEALGFFAEQQYRSMRWLFSVQQVQMCQGFFPGASLG